MARWSVFAASAAALVLVLPAVAAFAADDAGKLESAKTLVAEMAASRKAKDTTALEAQAKKAVAAHNGITDKGLRGKLQKELGSILKSKHLAAAHGASIAALGELNDSKGAYKQLRKHMPGPKTEAATDQQKAVLAAVDKLAPDGALKDLFELAEKAKDYEAGGLAIAALGSFKSSKKRVTVVETLIKLMQRFEPPRGQQAGVETEKRWKALAEPLIRALNEITGQRIGDPAEWHDFWKANKKKPAGLFVED